FKCENLQRMGAFKFRGAYNALSQLTAEERKRGVLAFSSGNHAQAVALAGKLLGIKTLIVMPENAPRVKLEATRGYGAEVVTYKLDQDRETVAARIAKERGMVTGALGFAALFHRKLPSRAKVGVILSGGNVDLRWAAAQLNKQ